MRFAPITALLSSLAFVTAAPVISRNINDPNAVRDYSRETAYHLDRAKHFAGGHLPRSEHYVADPAHRSAELARQQLEHANDQFNKALKAADHQTVVPTGPDLHLLHPHAGDYHKATGVEHTLHSKHHAAAAENAMPQGESEHVVAENIESHVWETTLSKKHADHANHHIGRAVLASMF